MERQTIDTFLTTPNFKIQEVTEFDQQKFIDQHLRNLPQSLKQKIINILKTFNDKELLNQAITNLGIPRNLVDIEYIISRPQQQMSKLHTIACALKKQIYRIKRSSKQPQQQKFSTVQSPKTSQQNTARQSQGMWQRKPLLYIKKQLSPQMRMKQAILKQLQYRQKLQSRSNKISIAQKTRLQFLSKRRENAKLMNKKVSEFYQKFKENQQIEFQNAFSRILQSFNDKHEEEDHLKRAFTQMSLRRDDSYMIVKDRFEKANLKFEEFLQRQTLMRLQRDKSLEEFKGRKINSINRKIQSHKAKSQQVLQRKLISSSEQQTRKLNNFIHKQIKYSQNKKLTTTNKDTRMSQSSRSHIRNDFRTSFPLHETKSVDVEKENEKENMILDKLIRKSQLKEGFIKERVERIKKRHRVNQQKRELFKESQMKFITQVDHRNNDSLIYQHSRGRSNDSVGSQQNHIKKNHLNVLKTLECQQTITKLRKLPKSSLLKHIHKIKHENEIDNKQQLSH